MNPCRDCQHFSTCYERDRAMLCRSYLKQEERRTMHEGEGVLQRSRWIYNNKIT